MGFWFTLFLFVAFTVLGELLRPKPEFDQPEPSGLGDFRVPTADGSRPIPAVFGRVLVRGPNVVWYGDLKVDPIIQNVRTGWFSSTDMVIGHKYYLGMQLALCHGLIDNFHKIMFDDKTVAVTTQAVSDYLQIDADDPELFGGEEKEGGIVGTMDLHYGSATQAPNTYLESVVTADMPGYHFVSHLVLRQVYIGTSAFIKNIAIEVSRFPNTLGLTGGKEIINTNDANPAAILYEILTNQVWGLKLSSGLIDLASFQDAGDALHAEGFGLSMIVDRQTDARGALEDILRHIDGVIYSDPATGIMTLTLAREDYTPAALDVYDEEHIENVEFSRGSWSETANTIQIRFMSRDDNYKERVAQQQNLAAIQTSGAKITENYNFLSASNGSVGNKIAARVLKTRSYPLAKVRLEMKRHGWGIRPGSVFKVTWPILGISEMICRAVRPAYGELAQGQMSIDCVEDIFAIDDTAFSAPAATGWVDPADTTPSAAAAETLIEIPYHLVGGPARHIAAVAVRNDGTDLGFEIWSDRNGGTAYVHTNTGESFAPSGLLTADYDKDTASLDTTGFTIDAGTDLGVLATISQNDMDQGVNLLLVNSEIMAFKTVVDNGNGTFTISDIYRGVLDTVAEDHLNNDRVYFINPPAAWPLAPFEPYPSDGTVTAKLLPFNPWGILPIASASQLSKTTVSRALKSYPPGNVEIDSIMWPTTRTAGVDIVVSWAHRHRVTQTDDIVVVRQDAGDYVSTPEGDYTIEVRVNTVLQRTVTGETGTSWTWTAAMQTTDGAGASDDISIRVIPVFNTLSGIYQEREFSLT